MSFIISLFSLLLKGIWAFIKLCFIVSFIFTFIASITYSLWGKRSKNIEQKGAATKPEADDTSADWTTIMRKEYDKCIDTWRCPKCGNYYRRFCDRCRAKIPVNFIGICKCGRIYRHPIINSGGRYVCMYCQFHCRDIPHYPDYGDEEIRVGNDYFGGEDQGIEFDAQMLLYFHNHGLKITPTDIIKQYFGDEDLYFSPKKYMDDEDESDN